MVKTEIIRYNMTERGRTHCGVARCFDIARIMEAIISAETQARARRRDMLGYLGYWPRIKFRVMPVEDGVIDGKSVAIEPAPLTTHLVFIERMPILRDRFWIESTTSLPGAG